MTANAYLLVYLAITRPTIMLVHHAIPVARHVVGLIRTTVLPVLIHSPNLTDRVFNAAQRVSGAMGCLVANNVYLVRRVVKPVL